jgi:hypothetical protein
MAATTVSAIVTSKHDACRSGDEFRHSSGDDGPDDLSTVGVIGALIRSGGFRRRSRAELGVAIGERMEVVISSSEPIIITDAWGARESQLSQNLILGGLGHRQAAEERL